MVVVAVESGISAGGAISITHSGSGVAALCDKPGPYAIFGKY